MRFTSLFKLLAVCCVLFSCGDDKSKLFTKLSESKTGIDFRNLLKEDNEQMNVMINPYFYNGGGVAVGDINNDGLTDIFFTGNMVKNRLFLNKGNLHFEDITSKAGIASKEGWCTGVTFVDINEDGNLDIYVCRSILSNPEFRKNLLFINNGDLTFSERAAEFGLDDVGYSTQASFFDYDKDGDLDMFLINESSPEYSLGKLEYSQLRNKKGDTTLANKLYRNDDAHFTNVSSQAGISSNVLTFSLGLSTADINQDGWPDIYVANDFNEHDYYYINNKDGSFSDQLKEKIDHTSQYSMGMDVADYNNDALPDILVLDMLPENNYDLKMHVGGDNYDKFNMLFKQGYYYQYMKNCLQKNNGDGSFSEIGQLAGIACTDWSWSPLIADFDNDGLKDIFVSNGYKRDNTNMQFIKYAMNQAIRMQQGSEAVTIREYISHMKGIYIENYMYQNKGNDQFDNTVKKWGLDQKSFSHGAVYADLDNDGDLDLITNNTDEYAGIYRNNNESLQKNHYLIVQLKGDKKNPQGVGTKIYAYANKQVFYQEQLTTRGFQSGITANIHMGTGKIDRLDSLRIVWPNDHTQLYTNLETDQVISAKLSDANEMYNYNHSQNKPFFVSDTNSLKYIHKENDENDFNRQFLLPQFYSHNGPCMAKGDVNGDGLEDIFIGGAKGTAGSVFIQGLHHQFKKINSNALSADSLCEDMDAAFFDADNDRDLDLYVASGGYEYDENSPLLADRLYINNGKGNFEKKADALPKNLGSKSCVRPCDIDRDGDWDLFVGGKVLPGRWPSSCPSSVYINGGKGVFNDQTEKYSKELKSIGIVTDAVWVDVNRDETKDLVIVGEWMAPAIFENKNGQLIRAHSDSLRKLTGWWNNILYDDFDGDGDADLVIGNFGLNSILKASQEEPVQLYATDIDGNGSIDPILTSYILGQSFPFVVMDDVIGQVPSLKKKFYDYETYAKAKVSDIIPEGKLKGITPLTATAFKTIYLENTGNGFIQKNLPAEMQYSPIFAMISMDVNKDGHKDIIACGNNICNRIRLGRHDANKGVVLLGDGKGNFKSLAAAESGLNIRGDVRSLLGLNGYLFAGLNNSHAVVYKLK